MSLRRASALLACVLLGAWLSAQPAGRLVFRPYGEEQGLDNHHIRSLAQTADGLVWVGTPEGLFFHDGLRFRHVAAPGLGDVGPLAPDPGGGLWVGTDRHLCFWDGLRLLPQGPDGEVEGLEVSPDGTVTAVTDRGLFRRRPGGAFEALPCPLPPALLSAATLRLGPGGRELWVGAAWSLWHRSAEGAWESRAIPPRPQDEGIGDLIADGPGALWIRTRTGLLRLAGGRLEDRSADAPGPAAYTPRLSLTTDGRLLVPGNLGLSILGPKGVQRLDQARDGLPTSWVVNAWEDRQGSLWIFSDGLYRVAGRGRWRLHGPSLGLPSAAVWALARDAAGRLWAGTPEGLAQAGSAAWQPAPETRGFQVRAMARDAQGGLWAAGERAGEGLLRLRPGASRWEPLALPDSPPLLDLLPEGPDLWLGTRTGLLRWTPETGARAVEGLPPELAGAPVFSLALDRKQRLAGATPKGLLLREGSGWRLVQDPSFGKDGLWALCAAPEGGFWIGAYDGSSVQRLELDPGTQVRERLASGTPDLLGKPYSFGIDAAGRLWMGTSRGAELRSGGRTLHLSQLDGLPGETFHPHPFFMEPDGRVWMGTPGGLLDFDPEATDGFGVPPRPVLLKGRFGERDAAPDPAPWILPRGRASLALSFALPGLLQEGKAHLQTRLEGPGGHDAWRDATGLEVDLPSLAPGRYRLAARAVLASGEAGPERALAFEVPPPLWATPPGLALLSVLLGLAAWGLLRWRLAALRSHARELQEEVRARTADLQSALQEISELSLKDPLTGLRNRRFLDTLMPQELSRIRRLHRRAAEIGAPLPPDASRLFLMVDLDHFKEVNDVHGHGAGDAVLKQVCERLHHCCRDTDVLVRWGGEEFLIVAALGEHFAAEALAERIRRTVRARPFDLGNGKELPRSCSIGFASYPFLPGDPDRLEWEAVVDLADRCLYAAKQSGRDAWVGLEAVPGAAPEEVAAALEDPERWASSTALRLASSFPPETTLVWKR